MKFIIFLAFLVVGTFGACPCVSKPNCACRQDALVPLPCTGPICPPDPNVKATNDPKGGCKCLLEEVCPCRAAPSNTTTHTQSGGPVDIVAASFLARKEKETPKCGCIQEPVCPCRKQYTKLPSGVIQPQPMPCAAPKCPPDPNVKATNNPKGQCKCLLEKECPCRANPTALVEEEAKYIPNEPITIVPATEPAAPSPCACVGQPKCACASSCGCTVCPCQQSGNMLIIQNPSPQCNCLKEKVCPCRANSSNNSTATATFTATKSTPSGIPNPAPVNKPSFIEVTEFKEEKNNNNIEDAANFDEDDLDMNEFENW